MSGPSQLAEMLRDTLKQVERSIAISPDDPSLRKLRHIIMERIARLEVEQTAKTKVE